jgi:hypothetical protein
MDIEKRYQQKLKSIFPHLSKEQIEALHSMLHGIVTAPFLSEKGLVAATKWLEAILRV